MPTGSIFGPKAMIVNECAGSGGDMRPWMFRKAGIGKLIGERTWGGLVGILGFPPLVDGGRVTAPNLAFYNTEGAWEVENHGVAPDIEVVLAELEKNPPRVYTKPAYPNYHKK